MKNHHLSSWIESAVLCLSVLYVGLHTMPRAWSALITDFPNYYMSARLAHDGYDTSRMYEWQWIEREKDHRDIDIRVIGLLPVTPFSTLFVWPLHRNLLLGQIYVFLLLLIVAACWSYLRGFSAFAGALVAVAAACKVFPALLFVFFLQRRDWRALAWGVLTGLAAAALSIGVFGWNVHRTWLNEILPWTLHGEGLQPYVTNASITGILHQLFLSEPQWNLHPWYSSPLCYSLLQPLAQMLALAPAILLIRRTDNTQCRILLEWSALITASLTVSTIPASYNFVLMVFPACVITAVLLQRKLYWWLAALLIAYLGVGVSLPGANRALGPALLLYSPRLLSMLAILLGIYALLWRDRPAKNFSRDWTRYGWAAVMLASVILTVGSTLHRERAMREEYSFRLPPQCQGYLNAGPRSSDTGILYSSFTLNGYNLVTQDASGAWCNSSIDAPYDELSFTSGFGHVWVERASKLRSQIVDMQEPSRVAVNDARNPMLSSDGRDLAFVRDDHGRGQLMVRKAFQSSAGANVSLTPSSLNVYEASFRTENEYAFSAAADGQPPQVYLTDTTHANTLLALGESRDPAFSPDGRWMAYSHLDHGVWNLWLRDQRTGWVRRVADVPCNQIQPSWESDSKTLLYGTDCGRGVWFTAVARRQVIPENGILSNKNSRPIYVCGAPGTVYLSCTRSSS